MKVVIMKGYGDPSVLHLTNREVPVPGQEEVLIKVHAAGINRPDIIQRLGKYPAPEGVVQDVLGLEVSGVVEKTGSKVGNLKIGDQVCALVPGGGYAEYVVAHEGSCLPIPKGISLEDAAALPETLFTVWYNIFQRGALRKGDKVLIYGGSGGIGSMAIQLVNLFGAEAYSLASNQEKIDYCLSLGAKDVFNYTVDDWEKNSFMPIFDLILDSLGGAYLDINLNLLQSEGRLVYINAMEGVKAPLNILKLMQKRITLTGSTLRARNYYFKEQLAKDIKENAWSFLENEQFVNPVRYRFPVEQVQEAHQLMDSRDFMGKIILQFT